METKCPVHWIEIYPVIALSTFRTTRPWSPVFEMSSSESQLRVGMDLSPHVRESGFRNPRNFCSWNLESWALQTVIQLKESGIPLPIGIQNPSSTDKEWTPVPGIRNPEPETVLHFLTWGEIYEFIFHYKI